MNRVGQPNSLLMTTHVNIGEARTRLSELVAAAVRGEEVVLDKAGTPQVKLTPVSDIVAEDAKRVARQRAVAIGMCDGDDQDPALSLRNLKSDRTDPDERDRLKFGDLD